MATFVGHGPFRSRVLARVRGSTLTSSILADNRAAPSCHDKDEHSSLCAGLAAAQM